MTQNAVNSAGTGSFQLPVGTEAQRPGTPVEGMLRYNSDDDKMEVYADGEWVASGGWTLYSTTTVTTSAATEDITIPTAFDECLLIASEIGISGGNTYLQNQFSNDSGSSFRNCYGPNINAGTSGSWFANNAIATRGTNAAGNKRVTLHLYNFGATNRLCRMTGYDTGNSGWSDIVISSGSDIDLIRFKLASGSNLNGGTIYLWVK